MTSAMTHGEPPAGHRPAAWRRRLGYLGGAALGVVLLVAAWAKLLDPLAFVEQIRLEGLDFWLPAVSVAAIALALELGIGAALVLGVRRWPVLGPAALLVAFFLVLTGRVYLNDLRGIETATTSCGCFGNLVERTPAEAFWQDLALLVPTLLLAFLGRSTGSPLPRRRLATAATVAVVGLVFAWQAPRLPLDNLATRLKPGVLADEICAGSEEERICLLTLIPELEAGEHLVVLADLADRGVGEAVERLNEYASSGHSLFLLSASPPEAHHAFFWTWGPSFEVREAPEGLLRPLYRTLPRSFLVRNGRVVETHTPLPPFVPAASSPPEATGAAF